MTTLKEQLIAECADELASMVAVICSNEQRLADCESICADLNEASKECKIHCHFQPIITRQTHIKRLDIAAVAYDKVTVEEAMRVLDAASLIYEPEASAHYKNDGRSIAFGVEGYVDQVVIYEPKHIALTVQDAIEALDGEQLKAA